MPIKLLLDPLLFFASFGALAVLFTSATAAALWAAFNFLRTIFGLPRALREFEAGPQRRAALRAELNRLKRAGP